MGNLQKFHVSIKGLVCYKNKFVLVKEPDGMWESPGGRVDVNEQFDNVLQREIKEELNIDIPSICLDTILGINQRYDYKYGDDFALCTIFYKINLDTQPKISLSPEHIEYIWIDKDTDLNKLSLKNNTQKEIFTKLQKSLNS